MIRSHRSAHRRLWLVLPVAVALGLAVALVLRAPAHGATIAVADESIA